MGKGYFGTIRPTGSPGQPFDCLLSESEAFKSALEYYNYLEAIELHRYFQISFPSLHLWWGSSGMSTYRPYISSVSHQSFVRCRRCRRPEPVSSRLPLGPIVASFFFKCEYCRSHSLKLPTSAIALIAFSAVACLVGALLYLSPNGAPMSAAQVEANNKSQMAAYEQLLALEEKTKQANPKLDNDNVLKFFRDRVSSDVIVQMIRSSPSNYDVSARGLDSLRQAQVGQPIIQAMIDAHFRDHAELDAKVAANQAASEIASTHK